MRIISKRTLREFWELHPDAEQPLKAWHLKAQKETWKHPHHLNTLYANVRPIENSRAVFNIKGNEYRLVVHVHYDRGFVYIRFVGTHAEYDKIDPTIV
jgi:mRNA interferase HigB